MLKSEDLIQSSVDISLILSSAEDLKLAGVSKEKRSWINGLGNDFKGEVLSVPSQLLCLCFDSLLTFSLFYNKKQLQQKWKSLISN